MSQRLTNLGAASLALLPAVTLTTAVNPAVGGSVSANLVQVKYLAVQAVFTYGSGGTSADAYVQTSLDAGATWIDIMDFHFTTAAATKVSAVVWSTALTAGTTATDGSLAANTIVSGLLGDRFRVKYISVGTYAGGTTLALTGVAKG